MDVTIYWCPQLVVEKLKEQKDIYPPKKKKRKGSMERKGKERKKWTKHVTNKLEGYIEKKILGFKLDWPTSLRAILAVSLTIFNILLYFEFFSLPLAIYSPKNIYTLLKLKKLDLFFYYTKKWISRNDNLFFFPHFSMLWFFYFLISLWKFSNEEIKLIPSISYSSTFHFFSLIFCNNSQIVAMIILLELLRIIM